MSDKVPVIPPLRIKLEAAGPVDKSWFDIHANEDDHVEVIKMHAGGDIVRGFVGDDMEEWYSMTEKEARSLIDRCSEIMSGYLGMPCVVTKEWADQECLLEIRYDSGSRVFWNMTRNAVTHIIYHGYYDVLVDEVSKIKKCIDDNRDIFNKLMWMYEHQQELGFCRCFGIIK